MRNWCANYIEYSTIISTIHHYKKEEEKTFNSVCTIELKFSIISLLTNIVCHSYLLKYQPPESRKGKAKCTCLITFCNF